MGKFFNGRVRKDRTNLIKYMLIALGVLIIIVLIGFILFRNNKNKTPELELKESINVEINGSLPGKKEFFNVFKNFKESLVNITYDGLDISTIGTYKATIVAEGVGSGDVIINVVDTTAPTLVLKDYQINVGEKYSIEDFVESCTDNSLSECEISYYDSSVDQDGDVVDYSAFTKEGTFLIKIVAKDINGNTTEIKNTNLIIGKDEEKPKPTPVTECLYGNLEVNEANLEHPLTVIVGDQNTGCAINRDLWDNETVQKPLTEMYERDIIKLKKDLEYTLNKYYPKGANLAVYPHYIAVLNDEAKGLVGYGLYVEVYISQMGGSNIDAEENLAVAYYLKSDLAREYKVNKYSLK